MRFKILLIEDEEPILDMISFALSKEPYEIFKATNTTQAQDIIFQQAPHLIVIDWMLPGQSGIEFIQSLKRDELSQDLPTILLTAKAEEQSKLKGFNAGADDYITKPFSPKELSARIKALLKRCYGNPDTVITAGPIQLNPKNNTVHIDDNEKNLSPLEYKLLHFFMSHPNQVFSREQLLNHVWGRAKAVSERTVDVHIRRLRVLIQSNTRSARIQTKREQGYIFIHEQDD